VIRSLPTQPQPPRTEALLAVIRLAALPAVLIGERLVPYSQPGARLFVPIFVLAAVYAALTAWRAWRRTGEDGVPAWQLTLDVLFLCALAYATGGPLSEARYGFFVLPVAAALLARPRVTAVASGVAVIAYVAVSVLHSAIEQSEAVAFEVAQVAYLLWTGVAATLLSTALARRSTQVAALAASRGRLVAQTLDSEDRERRQLAEALHDDAIQNLLAARQELAPDRVHAADLEVVRLGLDRTVAQLRGAVFDLHPYLLEHAGLGPALVAVAEDCARWGGFVPKVRVDPALVTRHEQLLFSVGRELIRNAALHAQAEHLRVAVTREGDTIALVVTDDGQGFAYELLHAAPLTGHIGLASMAERVEAVGGRFSIEGGPGSGTRVEVRLPVEEPYRGAPPRDAGAREETRADGILRSDLR
jgi:two-component system, NarL family, sensor kinase